MSETQKKETSVREAGSRKDASAPEAGSSGEKPLSARAYIEAKRRQKMEQSGENVPPSKVRDARTRRKRVLIISDTHGYSNDVEKLLRKVKPIDLLIHCGDVSGDEDYIRACAAEIAECPCVIVQGNNDFWGDLPREEVIMVAGQKILVAHGHRFGISYETTALKKHAKELGADIVCCGHTHVPMIDNRDKPLLLINPGSLALPRQSGREGSYAMLELDETGFRYAWINYLPTSRSRR